VRRRLSVLVLLGALASGCGLVGDDDGAGPAPTLPAETAVLRVASAAWPTCLDPVTCADPVARWLVWEHVLPKLLEVDEAGAYVPSPVLAGMPEVRVDAETGEQTITYVLDPQARWNDGRPITSSDVTGTWLAHRSTPGAVGAYDRITAVDDRDPLVARVTLAQPYADWPELFGGQEGWLLQADALGGTLDVTGRFVDGPTFGAGPFELASVGRGAIVLRARDEHWAGDRQASVDRVRIERLPDGAEVASVGADVDVVVAPGAAGTGGRFEAVARPTTEVVGVFLDRRSPPLGSQAVRAAVEAALDRGALADVVRPGGRVLPCLGWLPQQDACRDQLPDSGASPADAEALLDADGWPRVAGGGRGRPELPLLVPVSYDPALRGARRAAEAIVEALVPLGFGAVLQATDAATWRQGDRQGSTGIGVFAADVGTAEGVASLYRCEDGTLNPLGWCELANQLLARALVAAAPLGRRAAVGAELSDLAAGARSWLPVAQRAIPLLVDPDRVAAPDAIPLGAGPLGALHGFVRVED